MLEAITGMPVYSVFIPKKQNEDKK
jgi:hypothetical protein